MPAIDLRGIHFRSYSPQFDQNIEEGDYNPVGPGGADRTPGAIDLGIIKFRAWQMNDIASDTQNNSAVGGDSGGGVVGNPDPNGFGSIQPDGLIWPFDEILNV